VLRVHLTGYRVNRRHGTRRGPRARQPGGQLGSAPGSCNLHASGEWRV